jgi:hypothetical protein
MLAAAPFAPAMPMETFAPAQFAGQPVPPPSFGRPAQPYASPASSLAAQQRPSLPPPRFRAQAPDEPVSKQLPAPVRSAPIAIPTPEQLGVATVPMSEGTSDWAAANRRLDLLGAVSSHRERLPQGGYRFTCLLATEQADRKHRVEAVAATEEEAVRLALQRAEEWATGRHRDRR